MSLLCCCSSRRSCKRISNPRDAQLETLASPPSTRLPGPRTLGQVGNLITTRPGKSSRQRTSPIQLDTAIPIDPIGAVELDDLIVEESESDAEPASDSQTRKSSALYLVKRRIKNHLSQDSSTKPRSRSTISNSEEDIAWRSELKRLKYRRILEEICNDDGRYELPGSISNKYRCSCGNPKSGHESCCHERFSVRRTGDEDAKSVLQHPRLPNISHCDWSQRCWASCPSILPTVSDADERTVTPRIPSSPALIPIRLPSIRATSFRDSWRLSHSLGQLSEPVDLDDYSREISTIRVEGPTATSTHHVPTDDPRSVASDTSPTRNSISPRRITRLENSPLSTWLRCQDLMTRSPSLGRHRSSHDNAVNDSEEPSTFSVIRLHEMNIHEQLSTQGSDNSQAKSSDNSLSRCIEPRPSSFESFDSRHINVERVTDSLTSHHDPPCQATKEEFVGITTCTSSRYPSAANSKVSSLTDVDCYRVNQGQYQRDLANGYQRTRFECKFGAGNTIPTS
jgi:hypothetical protein